jgi:P-type Cu+ transporter
MDVNKLSVLDQFIEAAKSAKLLITILFIYSLLYNCIGLYYALSAQLQPMVAAILMPSSSISVILLAFAGTKYIGRRMTGANAKHDKDHVEP